ncbi:hypothetical protein PIB30_084067 [Stylosanthes scabra]|uniref:Uncharacterized protein n=1 Tax=Stylosanthes scabra TaxID=79078 RepID=A0ABU6ZR17_9FABA|nr:hypothetical protein [Stylosanthes scabra]
MIRKTSANKCASAACDAQPPPLSKVPLRRWFASEEVWRDFLNFYSKMPILKPRHLIEGLLPEDKYLIFWRLLDKQFIRGSSSLERVPRFACLFFLVAILIGSYMFWKFSECRYYPRLMAAVATTLRIQDNLDRNGYWEF